MPETETAGREVLADVLAFYKQKEIAAHLQIDARTVRRWFKGEQPIRRSDILALQQLLIRISLCDRWLS